MELSAVLVDNVLTLVETLAGADRSPDRVEETRSCLCLEAHDHQLRVIKAGEADRVTPGPGGSPVAHVLERPPETLDLGVEREPHLIEACAVAHLTHASMMTKPCDTKLDPAPHHSGATTFKNRVLPAELIADNAMSAGERGMPTKESFADHLRQGIRWPDSSVAEIPPMRSSRSTGKTKHVSSKMGRDVLCDSGLEASFAQALDQLPEVLYYQEQPSPIDYEFDGGPHRYYPDFLVAFVDKRSALIEVKINGYKFAQDRNVTKWAAAIRYCRTAGRGFFVGNSRVSLAGALKWPAAAEIDRDSLPDLATTLGWDELKALQGRLGMTNTEMAIALLKLGLVQDESTQAFRWASGAEQADIFEIMDFCGALIDSKPVRRLAVSRSVAASSSSNPSSILSVGKNTGKFWTADEEDRLLQLRRTGETVEGIAAQLGRRPRGVRMRLQRLGYKP